MTFINSKLGELVEIKSGYHFRRGVTSDPLGRVRVVQLSNLPQATPIDWLSLQTVNGEGIARDYFLEKGDVLLSSRGSKSHVILVDEEVGDVVVPNYLLILRNKSQLVTPSYLSWYLQQPLAQAQIERARQGSTVQLLSRTELAEMAIPTPPLHIQETLSKIGALADREQELLNQLKIERQRFISASLQLVTERFAEH
jgi:restriction endonuclease S subunit